MKNMKKFISLILSVLIALSCTSVLASAYDTAGIVANDPIIFLHGKVGDIKDSDGTVVYDFDYDTSNLMDDVVEVCRGTLLKGIITGNFNDYYDALYKKISQIYDRAQFDKDGNAKYGSYATLASNNKSSANRVVKGHLGYEVEGYNFWYDWRDDPYNVIDDLDVYIDQVLKTNGKDKVCLVGRCLGGAFITAYIEKYGVEKIKTIVYDEVTLMGGEMVSDIFSGKIDTTPEALTRFVEGDMAETLTDTLGDEIFALLSSTLNLLNGLQATGQITDLVMNKFYKTMGKEIVSAFARASFATWPAYWTIVKKGDYERAKTFIFGPEGSERRAEFAGLIEKTDNYYNIIKVNFEDILLDAKNSGVNIGIVAKYGVQAMPYVSNTEVPSDSFVSLPNSTFGATVSNIDETLSKTYLEKADSKYISVDKMVDTSTCLFPDYTWIIKGNNHDDYPPYENEVIRRICAADKQLTVNDYEDLPQFASYIVAKDDCEPMTEENMNCEPYANVNTKPGTSTNRVMSILSKVGLLIDFLSRVFKLLIQAISPAEPNN